MIGATKNTVKSEKPLKTIKVESRLSQVGLKAGGVSRSSAVKKASAAVDVLRDEYPEWLEKDLSTLKELIAAAHAGGGQDRALLDRLYGKTAQIRDLGTSFDFPMITATADSLCELIYRLRENNVYDAKSIDSHFNALHYFKKPEARSDKNKNALPLVRGLKALAERYERPQDTQPEDSED